MEQLISTIASLRDIRRNPRKMVNVHIKCSFSILIANDINKEGGQNLM